jgi:hypothetical protein
MRNRLIHSTNTKRPACNVVDVEFVMLGLLTVATSRISEAKTPKRKRMEKE